MEALKEFKKFALKGNMIDMAIGIVIGAAFGTVIKSLVADVITPPLGLLTEQVRFKNLGPVLRKASEGTEEVRINFGSFLNELVSFLIVAVAIFLVVKAINQAKEAFDMDQEEKPKEPSEEILLLREIRDSLRKQA
jgi:large conductance mechanosensitive channel